MRLQKSYRKNRSVFLVPGSQVCELRCAQGKNLCFLLEPRQKRRSLNTDAITLAALTASRYCVPGMTPILSPSWPLVPRQRGLSTQKMNGMKEALYSKIQARKHGTFRIKLSTHRPRDVCFQQAPCTYQNLPVPLSFTSAHGLTLFICTRKQTLSSFADSIAGGTALICGTLFLVSRYLCSKKVYGEQKVM